MQSDRSGPSLTVEELVARILEKRDPIWEKYVEEPNDRLRQRERDAAFNRRAASDRRDTDSPRSERPAVPASPETEAFVARIYGRPAPMDTAAFVAAITGEDNAAQTHASEAASLGEAHFNPDEPRDERGRWTTDGPGWSPELAARTGWAGRQSVPDGRCTGIERGKSNEFFEQQTWHFGEGSNERKVELRVVKKGTVVVYLTHWRSPDQRGRERAIVGNPKDGPGAGRCAYLSCWGSEYNKDPKTGIPGFPELHGMLGYGEMTRAQERIGREYGLDVSRDSINAGKGPSRAAFDGVMDQAWKAATDLGKQMSLANEPGKPTDTHAWRSCPSGVDVILVGGVPGVGNRYNKGVHFNSDGVPSPIKEKDLLSWNTY
jgi:hypothetical protein